MSRALGLALLVLAAPRAHADDWRDKPPPPGPAARPAPPAIQKLVLPSGLSVYLHERHDVPLVVVAAVFPGAGDAAAPAERAGLASFTAELLEGGAGARTAIQLADDLALCGASLHADTGVDAAVLELLVLKTQLARGLPILVDVLTRPTFPPDEFLRLRARREAEIQERADDPEAAMGDLFGAAAFGAEHPYGRPHLGTASSIARLSREEIVAFFREHYFAGGAALVFAGDLTLIELRTLLGKTPFAVAAKGPHRAPAKAPAIAPASPADTRGFVLVAQPDAAQSQVGFAVATVPRRHPDFTALELADATLGGAFTSRLNLNLRERHGYTYTALSALRGDLGPSLLAAHAAVRADATALAAIELRAELHRLRSEPPDEGELALARSQLIHGVVGAFETLQGAALATAELHLFDLPLDHYKRFMDEVQATDAQAVRRALEKHFDPSAIPILLLGDPAKFEPDLAIHRRPAIR